MFGGIVVLVALLLILMMLVAGNRERHRDDMAAREYYGKLFDQQTEALGAVVHKLEEVRVLLAKRAEH